jgi:hypothetical protein
MIRYSWLALGVLTLVLGGAARGWGAFVVVLGDTPLANNSPDERLPVYVYWDDTGLSPAVTGIWLSAGIGTADPNQTGTPQFRYDFPRGGILFANEFNDPTLTGTTIWQSAFVNTLSGGIAPAADNTFLMTNVRVAAASAATYQFSSTPELVAELRIDTTGVSDQIFNINIGEFAPNAYSFLRLPGDPVPSQYTISYSGSFSVGDVSAVPEPATIGLVGLAAVAVAGARRRFARTRRR